MIDETKIELISKVVDKEANEAEDRQLQELLRFDPEARRLFDELMAVSDKLSQTKEIDPPARLKLNIMRSIRNIQNVQIEKISEVTVKKSLASSLKEMFVEPFLARPSFSFITGIAAGLFLFIISSDFIKEQIPISNSEVSGTISHPESVWEGEFLNRSELLAGASSCLVETFRLNDGQFITEINVNSEVDNQLEITYNQEKINLMSYFNQIEGSNDNIIIENGKIMISKHGNSHITLYFDLITNGITDISVKFRVGDELQERNIPVFSIE